MTVLIYLHGGDDLWLAFLWLVVVPTLLITGAVYWIYKATEPSLDEKIKDIIYASDKDNENRRCLKK